MNTPWLAVATLLPVLAGGLFLNRLVPKNTPARLFIVCGMGALLGVMLTPQIMHLTDALGYGLNFSTVIGILAALSIALMLSHFLPGNHSVHQGASDPHTLSHLERLLVTTVVALITLRIASLGFEVLLRPLFPWDATMHWATKARVWFEHKAMLPFVDYHSWLELRGSGVFVDRHPQYPPMIPLLQVWMSLALDAWDESLINIPWLVCFIGIGATFYGQLRLAGVGTTVAAVSTYLLISLPLLNTHVALAGYADLFLGSAYGCAVLSLHNWIMHRERWLAVMAVLFGVLCILIKAEGVIWALSLIPAITVAYLGRREAAQHFLLLFLWGVLFLLVIPSDLDIAGYATKDLVPSFNFEALRGILLTIWVHDNWHLAGYFALLLIPLGVIMPGAMTKKFLGLTTTVACSVGAYVYLFIFTGFGEGAADFAAVGRLSIHLAPGLLFLCTLVYNELLCRESFWVDPDAPRAVKKGE
jgi:hypothetical protein